VVFSGYLQKQPKFSHPVPSQPLRNLQPPGAVANWGGTTGECSMTGDVTKKSEKKKQSAMLTFAMPGSAMRRTISPENDRKALLPTPQVSVMPSPPPVGTLPAMDLPSQEVHHRIPQALGATLPWTVSSMTWILIVETETTLARGREN